MRTSGPSDSRIDESELGVGQGGADTILDCDESGECTCTRMRIGSRQSSLYVQSGFSSKAVFNALGYPSKNSVKTWYREYLEELDSGDRHDCYRRRERYKQKRAAVEYYIEHGKSRAGAVRELGYPGSDTLADWMAEIAGGTLERWTPCPASLLSPNT